MRHTEHLEKMYRFGKTILLEYIRILEVLFRLKQLPVAKEHFDRWMELFTQTTDSLFTGALADEAKFRARTWQKCLITKLNISKRREKSKIIPKFYLRYQSGFFNCNTYFYA
jgi:hemoglobin